MKTHFEAIKKVKSAQMDFLTSRFEKLEMEEHESISNFSSILSLLVQEAYTLVKDYKDKKLVKKILRCLPAR